MEKWFLSLVIGLGLCTMSCTSMSHADHRNGMVIWLPTANWDGSVLGNSCSCSIDDSLEQLANAYGVQLWVYGVPGTEDLADALAPSHSFAVDQNIKFITPTVEFYDGEGTAIASVPLGLVLKIQKICHQLLPLLGEPGMI